MGQKAVQIIGVDVKQLLAMLNGALSEEWLAYYQYWIGARVMQGPMRSEIEQELLTHANQELGHATLLVDRIIQLGGTPVLTPAEWMEHAKCKYQIPVDRYIEFVLEQNLVGERCAIERYQEIADFTNGKDYATYEITAKILSEELEHEEDLENWLCDIRSTKDHFMKERSVITNHLS